MSKLKKCSNATNLSRCPIERGVVSTPWGTISPAPLIAAVASTLQETTINFKRLLRDLEVKNSTRDSRLYEMDVTNISSTWTSTIVGDLAEVTIQQALDSPNLGNIGTWNDSQLPRNLYLKQEPFDMTQAELLGDVDGNYYHIILSRLVPQLPI